MNRPTTEPRVAAALAALKPGTLITATLWVEDERDERDPLLRVLTWKQEEGHLLMVTGSPFDDKRMLADANGDQDYIESFGVVGYQLCWLPDLDVTAMIDSAVRNTMLPSIDRVVLDGADEQSVQRYGRRVARRLLNISTGRTPL